MAITRRMVKVVSEENKPFIVCDACGVEAENTSHPSVPNGWSTVHTRREPSSDTRHACEKCVVSFFNAA